MIKLSNLIVAYDFENEKIKYMKDPERGIETTFDFLACNFRNIEQWRLVQIICGSPENLTIDGILVDCYLNTKLVKTYGNLTRVKALARYICCNFDMSNVEIRVPCNILENHEALTNEHLTTVSTITDDKTILTWYDPEVAHEQHAFVASNKIEMN